MRTTKQRNFAIALVCVIAVCCCAIGLGCSFASRGGSQNGDNIAQVNVQKVAYAHDSSWAQINDQASLATFLDGTNQKGYLTTSFSVNWGADITSPYILKTGFVLDGNGQTITFNGSNSDWSIAFKTTSSGYKPGSIGDMEMNASGFLVSKIESNAKLVNITLVNTGSRTFSSDFRGDTFGFACGYNSGLISNICVENKASIEYSSHDMNHKGNYSSFILGGVAGVNAGSIVDAEIILREKISSKVRCGVFTSSYSVVGGITGVNQGGKQILGSTVSMYGNGKIETIWTRPGAGSGTASSLIAGVVGWNEGSVQCTKFNSNITLSPSSSYKDGEWNMHYDIANNKVSGAYSDTYRVKGVTSAGGAKEVDTATVDMSWVTNEPMTGVNMLLAPKATAPAGQIIWSIEGKNVYEQMKQSCSVELYYDEFKNLASITGATVLGEVGSSAVTSANVVYNGAMQSLKAKYYAKDGATVVGESAALANGKGAGNYSTDGNIPAFANAEKHVYVPAVTNGAVATLKVEPKTMTVTMAGTNVYDANYTIAGLVGSETINGKVNGTYQLEDTTELTFDAPANYSMAQVKVKASPYTFSYADGIEIVDKVGIENNKNAKTVAINARNVTDIAVSYTGNHVGHYTTLEFVGGTPSAPEKNNNTIKYTVSNLSTLTSVGLGKITSIAYNFGATAGANGKATVNGASTTTANYGNVVTFVATADAGYHFVGWFVDGNATAISFAEKYSTKAFGNKTLEARFAIDGNVKVIFKNIDGSNYKTGVANVGDVVADLGAGVTVTETQLYQTFIGWVADIQTVVIESGVTEVILTPNFSTSKNVTVKIDGVDKTYRFGQDITLTSANESSKWLVNGILASESKTFVVNAFDGLVVKEELTSATITNAESKMTFSCEKENGAIYFAATAVDGVKIVALGMILSNDNTFVEKVSAPAVGTIRINVGQFVMKVDENVFDANGFITKTNFWAKGYAVVENATGQQSIIYSAAQNIK